MGQILEIIVPVFGMAILGFACGRIGILDESVGRGLSLFVFRLAIPIMLFRTLGNLNIPEVQWLGMSAYYGVGALQLLGSAVLTRRLFGFSYEEAGAFGMGAAFSNTVLLALPIVLKVYGEAGTLPMMMIISCHTTVLFGLGTVWVETRRAKGANPLDTLRQIIKGLASNPIIIGLVSGLVFNFSGASLPGWLDEIAVMFSEAAVPCALFSMGLTLCSFKLAGNLKQAALITLIKLCVHPILMFVVARYVFHLSPMWVSVSVITASMPSGINSYLFAQGYGAKEATLAAAVLSSTGVAMFSVSVVLWLL